MDNRAVSWTHKKRVVSAVWFCHRLNNRLSQYKVSDRRDGVCEKRQGNKWYVYRHDSSRTALAAFSPAMKSLLLTHSVPATTWTSAKSLQSSGETMLSELLGFANSAIAIATQVDATGANERMVRVHQRHEVYGKLLGPASRCERRHSSAQWRRHVAAVRM